MNRLLETETPIPLEFLINGQFLRTSLDEFLTQNGISGEITLGVEYVKALVPPLYVASYEHDAWVSSVDVLSSTSPAGITSGERSGLVNNRILSGSYDGNVRIWNMSSEVTATGTAQTAAVKAVKFMRPDQLVSAGIDRTLRLWRYQDAETEKGSLKPTLELYGHKAAIDNLAVHTPSSRILSASQDGTVGVWSTSKKEAPAAPDTLLPTSNKRRKLSNASAVAQRGPLSLLQGHQSQVADVSFDQRDPTVAYSCSWDHSLKTWDLTTSTCVDTRTTAQSLLSLLHVPDNGLIATGTSARTITLIDPRAAATTVSAMTLQGHRNAVVSLATDPNSSHQFVSGSHDGTCRVWDIRSVQGGSVYVIDREITEDGRARPVAGEGVKVFDVSWDAEVGIVSGGEDKKVQINKGR